MDGYQFHFDALLVTIWSAPNYMYQSGNKASVMVVNDSLEVEFKVFEAVPDDMRTVPDDEISAYFV
jgi:hypothetical protein